MTSRKKNFPTANKIIEKLKLFYDITSDTHLAELLDVRPNTIAIWKVRNSIDLERIIVQCPSIDLNWLVDEERDELPPASFARNNNIEATPAALESYKKYRPSQEEGYVFAFDTKSQSRYPSNSHLKGFMSRAQGFDAPACFGWKGIIRMFQCDTRVMEPSINHLGWAITRYITQPWIAPVGRTYIGITHENLYWGILLDSINGNNEIRLQPSDKTYPKNVLLPANLKELWMVEGLITDVKSPSRMQIRMQTKR